MPPRVPSKGDDLASFASKGHGVEFGRGSKPHRPTRFAREMPLSPRASQSLKFKDKVVKLENPIRPPYADVPLEFVNNASNGYSVQAKYSGNQDHTEQMTKGLSKEDELIKYMSKVPGYLQKREKPQDNVFNFGVLDWGRLEKWTHKQSTSWMSDIGSSIPSAVMNTEATIRQTRTQYSIGSWFDLPPKVDFSPVVMPLKGKVTNHLDMVNSNPLRNKQQINSKDKLRIIDDADLKHAEDKKKGWKHGRNKNKSYTKDGVDLKSSKGKQKCLNQDLKSSKGKQKCLNQDTAYVTEISSSKLSNHDDEVFVSSNKKPDIQDAQLRKSSEQLERLDLDKSSQHSSGEQQSIVLLLPKDFSRPCSSEQSETASLHGKLAQHNWGSFSDLFSVDEIHADESFSDVRHSCSLNRTVETETDLDMKLNSLIKAQGVELLNMPADMEPQSEESNMKTVSTTSNDFKAASGSDETTPRSLVEMDRESYRHERLDFSLRSLSFKEGSTHPPLNSVHVKAKSGPANPEGSASSEILNGTKSNTNARARDSPFRRFLDPLLKSKLVRQAKEHSDDHKMKPPIPAAVPESEKLEERTVKALLHLTVKSGLPLFKFVVETNDEVLASTVKSVSSFGKDDISLLYTFYSVHKVRKKSSGWKNHKAKSCGFEYNVVGQMKVSKPQLPSWRDQKIADRCKVKESVLYSVDVSKSDASTFKFMTGRELAAIVVNMDNEESYHFKDEKMAHTVVILPGGDHSIPHEGVPSSLINRWRTGGLCDCGGWDEGCKIRILADLEEDHKSVIHSSARLMDFRCGLYDQGESQQSTPFFRLVPFRDGLFSVEFDAKMSSLQAFSICVAVINGKQPNLSSGARCAADKVESKQEFSRG
ncbi:hypothetical protein RND81_13G091400 [Saponaria officinalis]|uniref:DUF3527 domain protein n=1 Tax=Saponaria officinalis TaxID=3572 RepID=A0AAW1GVN6_SAPOF